MLIRFQNFSLKKTLTIALLVIFLFNVGGYYLIFLGWRLNAHEELVKRLDAGNYTPQETVEIKIPITLPYPLQQTDYERTNGKFEYQGDHYKLVKQKLANDTLYVVCIKDRQLKQIDEALNNYSKLANDLPVSEKTNSQSLVKLLKEYEPQLSFELVSNAGWMTQTFFPSEVTDISEIYLSVQSPPPDHHI